MILENQKIKVKWAPNNIKYYTSLGYEFTNNGDCFYIDQKDLSKSSKHKVKIKCDYCGIIYESPMATYQNGLLKIKKSACKNCGGQKNKEVRILKVIDERYNKVKKICSSNSYKLISKKQELKSTHDKVKFICPKHGEQSISLNNFFSGHLCYKCGRESASNSLKSSPNKIEKEINKKK